MAADLTKIQFTLCNEIKAKLKAVKELQLLPFPFTDLEQKVVVSTD